MLYRFSIVWNEYSIVFQHSCCRVTEASASIAKLYVRKSLMSSLPVFETLLVRKLKGCPAVLEVELNRPAKFNSFNECLWNDVREVFRHIGKYSNCRAVVLTAAGKHFTAGLDLSSPLPVRGTDVARRAVYFQQLVKELQESFNIIAEIPQPVIVAVHGACIGAGIDMITACDVRFCSENAKFSVKEVDVGIVADVGTFPRLVHVTGNDSLAREVCFTGRKFGAAEAEAMGLVSRRFASKDELLSGARALARTISEKSPIALMGIKRMMNYSRDHSVKDTLDYVSVWNAGMTQGNDMATAIKAFIQKKQPTFSKL
eukprot:60320_1